MKNWLVLCVHLSAALSVSAETTTDAAIEQSRTLRRQLMTQKTAAVAEKSPLEQEAALASLIEQIQSLQWPSAAATEPLPLPTAVNPTVITAVEPKPELPKTQSAPTLSADALTLLNEDIKVPYPLELADTLYRKGQYELAGRYYRMAMKAADKSDAAVYPWLLFQAANCLRHTEPRQAETMYQELIRLYPNSVWAAAAQARYKMLTWLNINQDELKTYDALRNDKP